MNKHEYSRSGSEIKFKTIYECAQSSSAASHSFSLRVCIKTWMNILFNFFLEGICLQLRVLFVLRNVSK